MRRAARTSPSTSCQSLKFASKSASLDRNRWLALWSRLGARTNGSDVFRQLAAAYTEPGRFYHTDAHIADCLGQLDWSRDLGVRPDEIEAALWFHDAVYLPGAPDNEERSASMASSWLSSGAVPEEVAARVSAMIRATNHLDEPPSDPDAQLLCDIDLSILGRAVSEFDEFERRIRQEYASVPEPLYRKGRAEVLNALLRRRSIYHTDRFARRYEGSARRNLERALTSLR